MSINEAASTTVLAGEPGPGDRAYWMGKLGGGIGGTQLPLEFPRSATTSSRLELRSCRIDMDTAFAARLRSISGGNDTRAFVVLVAGLGILVQRYCRSTEVFLGSPVHHAHQRSNTGNKVVVLRIKVDDDATVRAAVADVRAELQAAYAHQDYPFESALKSAGMDLQGNRTPLFNVAIALQQIHDACDLSGVECDLIASWSLGHSSVSCVLEYNSHTLSPEGVAVIGEQYRHILSRLVEDPERKIGDIECESFESPKQLAVPSAEYPPDLPIHSLIEQQVDRTPDGIALSHGDACLSYAELNSRANRVARYLSLIGTPPGDRVGVLTAHSFDMVAAILAVLKIGCAYVPIDTSTSVARLRYIAEHAALVTLITDESVTDVISEVSAKILQIDRKWSEIDSCASTNLNLEVAPDETAYVIYTSGSTGWPKGVEIQHSALVNYIWWARGVYLGDEAAAFAFYSSIAFDLTVTSIFVPLVTGNRIEIYANRGNMPSILQVIEEDRVDVIKSTPSHLALVQPPHGARSRLNTIIVGGEAFTRDLAMKLLQDFGRGVRILNEYGPTEATVACMVHEFDPSSDTRPTVPIGRPGANMQVYILDQRCRPTGTNMIGQIYISGDGLARGYLGDESLTAASFVENHFSPGSRMYATGDIARRLPNGVVEYLGREDDQVKIRGARIHLSEIQTVLNRYDGISESIAVLADDPERGGKMLVAYYVARKEVEHGELRDFLANHLLQEAIPGAFVHLRRLPLTVNGKLNKAALPVPKLRVGQGLACDEGSVTATEEIVRGIWEQLLRMTGVGLEDNFFGLGGHSLLATQVISRLRSIFGVELTVRTLFESPTVAMLARRIEQASRKSKAPPIEPVSREHGVPLSFAQQRLWFIDQLEPGSAAYNIPFALRLEGELDAGAVVGSVSEIVRRHEVLRTSFPSRNGEPLQHIAMADVVAMPMVDLSELGEAENVARELAVAEARRAFELAGGPLLRITLLRLGERDHVLLATMHHVVSDGWSVGILIREFTVLYEACHKGEPSPLHELPIQYADYAVWQREWLQGEALGEQLAYWRRRLEGLHPLEQPIGRKRPLNPVHKVGVVGLQLGTEVSETLRALSRREGVTLFMTLLAAFQLMLGRIAGERDVAVGTDVANRNRLETEELIGFFVNQLVLRTDLGGNPSFAELLGRIREVALGAYAHQDLPFERLVEELAPERALGQAPIVQAKFVLQNQHVESLAISGVSAQSFGVLPQAAKLDIMLNMMDTPGGLMGNLQYSSDVFSAAAAEWLMRFYESLLEVVAARSDQDRTSVEALISEAERRLTSVIRLKYAGTLNAASHEAHVIQQHWRFRLGSAAVEVELWPKGQPSAGPCSLAAVTTVLPITVVFAAGKIAAALGVSCKALFFSVWQILLSKMTGRSDMITWLCSRVEAYESSGVLPDSYVPVRSGINGEATFAQTLSEAVDILDEIGQLKLPLLWTTTDDMQSTVPRAYFNWRSGEDCSPVEQYTIAGRLSALLEANHSREDFITLRLWYEENRCSEKEASRMLGRFTALLDNAVRQPNSLVRDLDALPEDERLLVTREWAVSPIEQATEEPAHLLFEHQVQRSPDSIAVTCEAEYLTYEGLNERANQLGHYLRDRGVGPDARVALCLERSPELVISILGVLKAGGAYVPLDPGLPLARISHIMMDAEPRVVITRKDDLIVASGDKGEVVVLDGNWQGIAQNHATNPEWTGSLHNLAYIIYTSGSTGSPKGVMIEHRGLANYLSWSTAYYAVESGSGAPIHSSVGFDLMVTSLFPPLLAGRQIDLLPDSGLYSSIDVLCEALQRSNGYSLVKLTPAHMQSLDQLMLQSCHSGVTNALVVGGEALDGKLVTSWRQRDPEIRIINEYGPTETVVGCCVYELPKPWDAEEMGVPIGQPIANTRLYVLDDSGKPVGVGVTGELYIGGVGVARGYHEQPDLTAEKFVPDEIGSTPGARLYRTGDRVRWQADGNLKFLGRIDDQVKIRGYRIEPGEIEAVLSRQAGVEQCAVVAREQRLIAYVALGELPGPGVSELRTVLQAELPEYMVPSAFVVLERLPLTANGKVDRKALPEPEIETTGGSVAPRTTVEEIIAGIWAEVLERDQVGVEENFFDLGGHSLLATRVISRVRKVFGVELPVRALFEAPTVVALAKQVESMGDAPDAPPLERASREQELPLSFAQQRLWFIDRLEPSSAAYNLPFGARFKGKLDLRALSGSFTEIVRRHEALRASFPAVDDYPVQHIASPEPVTIPLVDLSDTSEPEAIAQEIARQEAQRPFDLSAGPLWRAIVLRLAPLDHIKLLTMHHIVSDGHSAGILIHDFTMLYQDCVDSRPSTLPELPIQYADFAVWQRRFMRGVALEEQLDYWRQQLHDISPLHLPSDRPRSSAMSAQGGTILFSITEGQLARLRLLCRREGVTLYMALLAGFQGVLYRWTGQPDVIVGSPRDNRDRQELESVVGFFVNTLPLRAKIADGMTFRELLSQMRETVLGALAHDQVPFEKIVEEVVRKRSLGRSPLLQVWFLVQNAITLDGVQLPDLEITPFRADVPPAKLDLALIFTVHREGISASLTFATDIFEEQTIKRLARRIQAFIEAVLQNPDLELAEIRLSPSGAPAYTTALQDTFTF
jgi:amino acid adenylation domain-containing protein